ncbi:MAG: DNA methyltransferase [Desulfobacca sp.]|nr:DNA methyltransferase [Desulfobacca sp.]
MSGEWKNKLYFGDNLEILREQIQTESVDLIYLDPPFNSQATYNILFAEKSGEQSAAQITAFEDTWHWGLEAEKAYHEVVTLGPRKLADLLQALRSFLGSNDMMAYLTMMAIRLDELHRVLKPTGSIYLHCDPTASHYLKLLMDAVFGYKNFLNEVVWYYRGAGTPKAARARRHDILLFYAKMKTMHFFDPDPIRQPYAEATVERFAHYIGNVRDGHDYGLQRLHPLGKHPDDVITHIQPIAPSAKARLGYPTQKPEELLEEIIKSSSREGDIVFDPFCGCGTTIAVAERLQRRWIGIDITHLAITLIKKRLQDTFGPELTPYAEIGAPEDYPSAEALATLNRHQFEWWALGLVEARPAQDKRKGPDTGIDGLIYFFDDQSGQAKKIVIQVKSGNVTVSQLRDLKGVMEREKAVIGVFITLKEPTKPMLQEAAAAGFYEPEYFPGRQFPRLQILSITDLLTGQEVQYPRVAPTATFKKAQRQPKGSDAKPQQNAIAWEDHNNEV